MYARRHHRREHIPEANFKFKPKCWEERTPYTEPLRIDRVDGNKETRTVYTPDLNSLNGLIAAKYPLIDLNQLKASNCAENSHQDIVGKRMNLRIQAAVATKEGNQYKVVFQSGEGFADFAAQIKTVLHKRCW
ncbi:hypothetical protein TVAG_046200 [Trichomonas vaginalis G3]|uniref:Uncharacterized protein n=1 Tax=Trichomonas vaginalis (strain ATCC PRA-98 / G3) TaxID=412133 RepID=A2DMI9_TRIV3|nr:hypothetical protein TVAGG3_0336480 [Trichomonas vaginalis G3]EAY18416.1 hypothetical protein TVAG_046200 [Trichomonas vaginalis G3]KAI5530310.1 hypothetical protein TVAGG3_0336480 [Trichomonas vaginalis G3]|eukprot:XP_001579402.1 hypothetical protein [Trichomonas vaginalis G3]